MLIIIQSSSASSQYYYGYPRYSNQHNSGYNYEYLIDVSPGEYDLSIEFFGKQLISNYHIVIDGNALRYQSMISNSIVNTIKDINITHYSIHCVSSAYE